MCTAVDNCWAEHGGHRNSLVCGEITKQLVGMPLAVSALQQGLPPGVWAQWSSASQPCPGTARDVLLFLISSVHKPASISSAKMSYKKEIKPAIVVICGNMEFSSQQSDWELLFIPVPSLLALASHQHPLEQMSLGAHPVRPADCSEAEPISKANMPWMSWQSSSCFQFYPISDGSCSEVIEGEKWLLDRNRGCKLGFIYQSLTFITLQYAHSETGDGGTMRWALALPFQPGCSQASCAVCLMRAAGSDLK